MTKLKEALLGIGLVLFSGLLIFGMGVIYGSSRAERAHEIQARKDQIAALAKVRKQDGDGAQISQAAGAKVEDGKAKAQAIHRGLKERIPTYVPVQSTNGYVISNGFVSVWNAISDGDPARLSDAPGEYEAEPSTVQPSAILEAHNDDINYCTVELGKYQQLWDWTQLQAKLANEGAK